MTRPPSPRCRPSAYASLAEHVFINQPIGSLVATSTRGPDAAVTGAALYAIDKLISNPTLLTGHAELRAAPESCAW